MTDPTKTPSVEIKLLVNAQDMIPGIVITQDTNTHPAGLGMATILHQRLNKLIEQHGGNIVDALLAVVPVSGE